MSQETNTLLMEWANEIMDEFTGTWIEDRVQELVRANDLEGLSSFIKYHGAEMSRLHFHNRNIEEFGDVY